MRVRTNHWVKMHIKVPKDMIDKEVVQLEFDPSCEVSEPYQHVHHLGGWRF